MQSVHYIHVANLSFERDCAKAAQPLNFTLDIIMPTGQRLGSVLLQTYLFWFVVSLFNFDLLSGLAIPILAIFYVKFLPFLVIPVVLSIAGVVLISKRLSLRMPLIFNVVFLALLLLFGGLFKNALIGWHLRGHTPQCVDYGSFAKSALVPGRNFFGNGIYEEGGKVYLWSYSTLSFYEARPTLAVNFSCNK